MRMEKCVAIRSTDADMVEVREHGCQQIRAQESNLGRQKWRRDGSCSNMVVTSSSGIPWLHLSEQPKYAVGNLASSPDHKSAMQTLFLGGATQPITDFIHGRRF